ncbi:hypothetical protein [Pararhodobacter sp.]|uniref:hypothetical protein n=1 Tax=Pararhodobacter sp. TaxID=2127056 RepID=UPI002AFF43CE|nr:hypothetical protein [Pararhodobacter sp.]
MMLTDRRFGDAIKASGIKNIALLDDAFDVPKFNESDYSALYDFLETEEAVEILSEVGVTKDVTALAMEHIQSQSWTGEELLVLLQKLHRKYLVTRDPRFDPTMIFKTKQSNNLADVDPLLELLNRCKVDVTLYGRVSGMIEANDPIPDLVFADYYLADTITSEKAPTAAESEEATGASLARLDEILKPALAKDKHPSIILMSSKDVEAEAAAYRRKASGNKGKVFASRFGFIRKSDVRVEKLPADAPKGKKEPVGVIRPAADILLDIVQSHPFGLQLHSALLLWLTHSESAVGNMRKEIEELELKDFAYLVNYRLAQEGLSLFDYLEWFFGECLLGSIGLLTADKTKRPTRDKLDKHANLIEGAYDGRTEKIAELYHRARIDTNLDPAHMRMGDLYLTKSDGPPNQIWALLTPDCDLIVRNGKRSVDRFLLVEGGLQAYNAPKSSLSDFIILDASQYSIEWKLKNLATRENLEDLRYCGTLRPLYAQDLQNQVLENLGRVGLAVAPVIRMDGHFQLLIRKSDSKLHEIDLGEVQMRTCEVYPSRGGSDVARISLHRAVAENLLAKLEDIDLGEMSKDDATALKGLRSRGTQEAVRTALCSGAKFEIDLGAKFMVSDKLTAAKNWCGLQVEMVAGS